MNKRKFLILDRDGTLIELVHHLSKIDQVFIIKESIMGCVEFKKQGYEFGMITNQSVIGLGMAKKENVDEINSLIQDKFREHGLEFKFMYICPHTSSDMCHCRKPGTMLGLKAIKNFNIDLNLSYMVGDTESDMDFGYNLGMKTIFVGNKESQTSSLSCKNLLDAAYQVFGVNKNE